MNYILAVFIPPLSVLLTGKIFSAVIIAVLWVASVAVTMGLSHPVFVILAWIIIARARGDKRHNQLIKTLKERE